MLNFTDKQGEDRIERIVIATRESPLALWQAEHVKARLEVEHPDLDVRLWV